MMPLRTRDLCSRVRGRACGRCWAGLVIAASIGLSAAISAQAGGQGRLSFKGNFETPKVTAWNAVGGGAQCANYGTPSVNHRLRGNFFTERSKVGHGASAGRFDLPPSQLPEFPLQSCELSRPTSLGLGTDSYYGYMFYVPVGWRTGTSAFWGVATAQFHFQNIWGAPIEFELHSHHMTLALQTGACDNYQTAKPGCRWRSNADNHHAYPGKLRSYYVVPPGMRQGVWHEVIMHVHWASDSSGVIEVWHRVKRARTWTRTVNLRGRPTVQWDKAVGCCYAKAADKIGAYRDVASAPVSVWLDNYVLGNTFCAVAKTMSRAPRRAGPTTPACR